MNADLQKIRDSRLFRRLPERAFNKLTTKIKVRSYAQGEEALRLSADGEFSKFIGYIVSGRILFMNEGSKLLGLAAKDEFFLGRPFSLNDATVSRLIAASDPTLIVFVPKDIIAFLSQASGVFSEMIESIYESVYDRAKIIASEQSASHKIQDWLKSGAANKTLATWVGIIESKRIQSVEKARAQRKASRVGRILVVCTFVLIATGGWETFTHWRKLPSWSVMRFLSPSLTAAPYTPGSLFNNMLGILGLAFILLTFTHRIVLWGNEKRHWKLNFIISQHFHSFFGWVGFSFILMHSAFHLKGTQIPHLAFYILGLTLLSGLVGQLISSQIPKSIRGEKIKLESLRQEQRKLRKQAELIMDHPRIHKSTMEILLKERPPSFWGNVLDRPRLWMLTRKMNRTLKQNGLTTNSAFLAGDLMVKEYRLHQKIRLLQTSEGFFRKWMLIHRPLGYLVYILAAVHVLMTVSSSTKEYVQKIWGLLGL